MKVRERCWFPGWRLLGAECTAKKGHFSLIVVPDRELKKKKEGGEEQSCEQEFQQDLYKVYKDVYTYMPFCVTQLQKQQFNSI